MTLDTQVPTPLSFRDFGLSEDIARALEASGYVHPTPIQAQTIPLLLSGQDVLGTAQTGTGKTAAFALPMLQRVDLSISRPQILVLAPTRELAIQVSESFEKYAAEIRGLRVAAIYGGQDYQIQLRKLHRGAHVVVGTPGRIMDHLRRGTLVLDAITGLVLDEADEMLRMGFAEDVDHILGQLPETRQIALFSATMPDPIRRIASQHLRQPAEINIDRRTQTAESVRQRYAIVSMPQKAELLKRILEVEPIDGVLVFVKTRATCEPLAEYLEQNGHRTAALHGDVPQKQRERIIDQLRSGELNVIIATDVAARGLDVQRISHVFNYDLPFDVEAYIHRIGRTGRAGRTGDAILFITPRDRSKLDRLERATRKVIESYELPSNRELNKRRIAKFHSRIEAALEHKDSAAFASIVEQFRRTREDITIEQIAGALACMANGDKSLLEQADWKPSGFAPNSRDERRPPRGSFDDRDDRRAPRGRNAGRRDERMDTYRIEVGRMHGVSPGNIVGAIANEIGIDGECIGRIAIEDDHSFVDLPVGLPDDLFQVLQGVQILGKRLNTSRAFFQSRPSFGRPREESRGRPRPADSRPGHPGKRKRPRADAPA